MSQAVTFPTVFTPRFPVLIGLDSDGCVFDVMDVKHTECFCPAFIRHFGLQPVARAARACWEFVNLDGASRGTNRFAAVPVALDLLARHPQVRARGFTVRTVPGLRRWLESEKAVGGPALERAVQATGDADLAATLAYHQEASARITAMVHGMPPFAGAADAIRSAGAVADLVVVSQATSDAIQREWSEHGLMPLVRAACGQEMGSKASIMKSSMANGYAPGFCLLVGDAPGDQRAAEASGARFFPIIPGDEPASWARFAATALPRLLAGAFNDAYQQELLGAFRAALPEHPAWLAR